MALVFKTLKGLEYKNDRSWETHLNNFHEILGKPASLGKPVPDDQKISKLIRTLPDHFALLAMISSHMSFEYLVNVVETEISKREMRETDETKSVINPPKANTASSRHKEVHSNGIIEKKKSGKYEGCWICVLSNQKSRDCWHRTDKLPEKVLPPFRGRGGLRGSYRGRELPHGGRGRGSHYHAPSYQV